MPASQFGSLLGRKCKLNSLLRPNAGITVRLTPRDEVPTKLNPKATCGTVADLRFGGPDALTAVGAPQSLPVGQQTRCRVFKGFISQLLGYIYFSQAWLTT